MAAGLSWLLVAIASAVSGAALLALGLSLHVLPVLVSPLGGALLAALGLLLGGAFLFWVWLGRALERALRRPWNGNAG
ncbi:MAG: hypothetical protein NZ695_01790 [Dehalococcoidia bacterium]|jgi:hypothetical protein|nr:hypothetical protein [Dehalococcoidia bacterium]MDW8009256.1 hypothetical protein [Chloroflexota bacterium]